MIEKSKQASAKLSAKKDQVVNVNVPEAPFTMAITKSSANEESTAFKTLSKNDTGNNESK